MLNSDKTSYVRTLSNRAKKLPGTCSNDTGIQIVGRVFELQDNTAEDITRRIRATWAKFGTLIQILNLTANCIVSSTESCKLLSVPIVALGVGDLAHYPQESQHCRGLEKKTIMRVLIPCPHRFKDLPLMKSSELGTPTSRRPWPKKIISLLTDNGLANGIVGPVMMLGFLHLVGPSEPKSSGIFRGGNHSKKASMVTGTIRRLPDYSSNRCPSKTLAI